MRTLAAASILSILVLSDFGCGKSDISERELRSQLKAIGSLASETVLFSRQVQENKVTSTFASAHFQYLHDQDAEILEDLTKAQSSGKNETILQQARIEASALRDELSKLSASPAEQTGRVEQVLEESGRLEDGLQ